MPRLKILLMAFCILLASSGAAIAAGEAHELPWGNFAFRILTFALFIGIIAYFFGKKITAFFKSRTEGIASQIAGLEKQKVTAQANLQEVEKRIANLEQERQAILDDFRKQGEAAKAAILAEAERAAEQITAQARASAENEIQQVMEAMRSEMADKIVRATEALLAEQLSQKEHTKLIDKYLNKVVLH